jgi:hypothetical protein
MRRSGLLFYNTVPTVDFADFLRLVGIPGKNLYEIDEALQVRFFQKNGDGNPKERWELDSVSVPCTEADVRNFLRPLGFIEYSLPSRDQYKYGAWPGALLPRAATRLHDLATTWHDHNTGLEQLVVFGGKRPIVPDKENPSIARQLTFVWKDRFESFDSVATELDLMKWLWCNMELPEGLRALPTTFVDAPMKTVDGKEVRPNTEDTINCWLETKPVEGSILVSSGAPYGMAQDEAFASLCEPHGFTVETFGHECPANLSIELLMREVAGTVNRIAKSKR